MDFGVFLPIANNGWIASTNSPKYMPSFELNRQILERSEQYGLKFALSMVKFRGFGGKTEHWDYALESLTLTSALVAATRKIKVYASIATLTLPPPIVARMAVTIDDVSPGRFGLNIVGGWNRSEYDQMGLWPGDEFYSYRYEYAEEYVTILRDLWTTGRSDRKGQYFTMDDCRCLPLPRGKIDVVYAGASQRGHRFAAEYADYNFTIAQDVDGLREANASLANEAKRAGRDVTSYPLYMVIIDDTDEAARRRLERYEEGADVEAFAHSREQTSRDTGTISVRSAARRNASMGTSAPVISGSPATVAAKLDEMAAVPGSSGMMFMFDDFLEGVERFGRDVMPLMQCAGT